MLTPPAELTEAALRAALAAGWSLPAGRLDYRPVGFGSHHWEVTGEAGARFFVTVDDLHTRRVTAGEPVRAAFGRLRAALTSALALRRAGRDFVVAPLPAGDGEPVVPLGDRYAVAVYPFVDGQSFAWNAFTPPHRRAVLDLLARVHTAPPQVCRHARADDYRIHARDGLAGVLGGDLGLEPELGPYARPATELLRRHAPRLQAALARYDDLVAAARADPAGTVLTHGEPHPGNTMRCGDRWLLIDWDTALTAPPERDLWDLDPGDGSLLDAYADATGTVPRPGLLTLYRLRWDLTDIAVDLARFREPHGDTADDQQTWTILRDLVTGLPAVPGTPGPARG